MRRNTSLPGFRPGRYVWIAVVLALSCSASVALGSTSVNAKTKPKHTSIAGTWSGSYSGAFTGTFTLHWTQRESTLHGSITLTSPKGKYGINGSVHKGKISFGVVGAGATYTGSWSGTSMSGSYKSPEGGGSWSAHKTS